MIFADLPPSSCATRLTLGAAFSTPAYSYVDPGTGSLILQGVIAAVAGAAISLRLYWGRLRSLFSGKTADDDTAPTDRDHS